MTNLQESKKENYTKGIRITQEELQSIGRDLDFLLSKTIFPCSPEREKRSEALLKRLREAKK